MTAYNGHYHKLLCCQECDWRDKPNSYTINDEGICKYCGSEKLRWEVGRFRGKVCGMGSFVAIDRWERLRFVEPNPVDKH